MGKQGKFGIFAILVAAGMFLALNSTNVSAADGKAVYESANCKMCHAVDGKGNPKLAGSMGAEKLDLTDNETAAKKDAELAKTVADGAGKMKPYKDKLGPDDVTAVVKYVRTLKK